mmetsp:Transcript_9355/g.28182  ORF Transcript_9355/g.28182 Transcript_9355/m.28182 type:complete len:217 (+) Transcript_9355:269-919(+)
MYLLCMAARARRSDALSASFGSSSWLTTMFLTSISSEKSSCTNLSVSYTDRNSAMATQTNVVCSGSFICLLTWFTTSLRPCMLWGEAPKRSSEIPPLVGIWESSDWKGAFSACSCSSTFSKSDGKLSSLRVWPVGAVSKTTTENSIDFISFVIWENETSSSMPGMNLVMSFISSRGSTDSAAVCGSISMANRLSKPSTLVGSPPGDILCLNASDRL